MSHGEGQRWAIVLAGGEGTRLAAVTRAADGRVVPKQFASVHDGHSFLQMTIDRIKTVVPPERTVVVVGDEHAALARAQLATFGEVEIVCQPRSRGTAAGVLLPLAHILARAPEARVVIFPSDHHVKREQSFVNAVGRALVAAEASPVGVTLVGAAAEAPTPDLGWVSCGGAIGPKGARARRVEHFVEKPDGATALALLWSGALWNTLILAARGRNLWSLVEDHAPEVGRGLTRYAAAIGRAMERQILREVYETLPDRDISRDILAAAEGLWAVSMIDAGWSDCGTPERLFCALPHLRRTTILADLARPESSVTVRPTWASKS